MVFIIKTNDDNPKNSHKWNKSEQRPKNPTILKFSIYLIKIDLNKKRKLINIY